MEITALMAIGASLILLLAVVQLFRRCERLENRIEDVCNENYDLEEHLDEDEAK